jgi:N-acetylneuraminic acid mutarotase
VRPIPKSHVPIFLAGFGLMAALGIGFLAGRRLDAGLIARLSGAPAPPRRLDAWTQLHDAPITRYEAGTAAIDNRIWIFGGFDNERIQASAEVWVYDPEPQTWTRLGDLPSAVTHINAALLGDTVWFAGGFVGDHPGPATDQVWRYEWRRDRWTPGPPLPARRGGGGLAAVHGKLHYFGGFGEDRVASRADHWILDPADSVAGGRWVAAAPLPKPRGHLGVAIVGDQIYAIGGCDVHDPVPLDVPWVHRYDPASDSWTEVAPLPFPRSHFEQSTLVRNGRILVLGGRSLPIGHGTIDDVIEYDPVADRWLAGPPLPMSLHSPFAALIGERMFVGLGGTKASVPNNVEVWSQRTDMPWSPAPPPPAALGEVSAAAIGSRFYLVGDGEPWTLGLDLGTGRWDPVEQHAIRPAVGTHHAAEVWNGQLYLFGGIDRGAGLVQIYDPATDRWRYGPSMPFTVGSSASALIGSQIYLAGGIGERGTTSEAMRFDPATEIWTPIAPMPLPRNHAAAATDGRRFFVFGGRGPGSGDHNMVANGFDEVQIYDPTTDAWVASGQSDSAPARLPQARGGMGKAVYDGREFWVFGGETLDGPGANRSGVYSRVDIYDPVTNRWRSGPPMPTARHGVFPVLVGDRILVVGGGTRAGQSASVAAEALELRPGYRAPDPARP